MPADLKKFMNPRRMWRGIANRVSTRAVILAYHRICDSRVDPCLLNVCAEHFEQHLKSVTRLGHPMRLGELAERVRDGRVPSKAVCLTFDDGYADNLVRAKPLLEKYGIPATVFATTGPVGRKREFWWDELEGVFLRPGRLPRTLELRVDGRSDSWDLGESASLDQSAADRTAHWTQLDAETPTARHAAFRGVHKLLLSMKRDAQSAAIEDLRRWAGLENAPVRPDYRALELQELPELERGGLIEIGAHTVNHSELPSQSPAVQREEIVQSKRQLERQLGHAVNGFAFPYGRFATPTVDLVREAGFTYACSTLADPVRRRSDLYLLPRQTVMNWNGDEFAARLGRWLTR